MPEWDQRAEAACRQGILLHRAAEALARWAVFFGVKPSELFGWVLELEPEDGPDMITEIKTEATDVAQLHSTLALLLEYQVRFDPDRLRERVFNEIVLPKAGMTREEYERRRREYEAAQSEAPPTWRH